MAQLSPEMLLLLEKMTEKMNNQTTTITENITSIILQKVDEKIKPLVEENEKLKNEVEKLSKKIENLETNAKRNNILIHGIPEINEEKPENLTAVITTTLSEIDVQIEHGEIDRALRLGKKTNVDGRVRPILLATTTLQKKIEILKNKKKMRTGTYITQDLTKEALQRNQASKLTNKGNDKRKRSETPSPQITPTTQGKETKVQKLDAFQHMRERSYSLSLSDKNNYRKQ